MAISRCVHAQKLQIKTAKYILFEISQNKVLKYKVIYGSATIWHHYNRNEKEMLLKLK